ICPHHPEAKEKQYRRTCTCRKPKTGLLEQAAAELELDLALSFMVGDRWSDLRCGVQAGATSILVLTGYGRGDLEYIGPQQDIQPAKIAEDLKEAVDWIIKKLTR
ncbi:MAG: D,D-heptose 1,7-bisphosphate phosphatase, partial [Candidatus Electrothrix sp. AR3]|nr:D,D-heptose 1,7-bisphosphate phosphatase [Candidatus Electrothrix sp. AR3]